MTGDDLLRKGLESARTQADEERRLGEAEAADRRYMERRIKEFLRAVDQCLRLMHEHGNPGLKNLFFTIGWARRGWRLGSPGPSPPQLIRAVTPSGEFFDGERFVKGADFIRRKIAADERLMRESWAVVNKRRTVNFVGTLPASIGDGERWRARVDYVIESSANDLGELLHRHGIDVP